MSVKRTIKIVIDDINAAKRRIKKGEELALLEKDVVLLCKYESELNSMRNMRNGSTIDQAVNKTSEVIISTLKNGGYSYHLPIRNELVKYLSSLSNKKGISRNEYKRTVLKYLAILDDLDTKELRQHEGAYRKALGELDTKELQKIGFVKKSVLPTLGIDAIRVILTNGYCKAATKLDKYINKVTKEKPDEFIIFNNIFNRAHTLSK